MLYALIYWWFKMSVIIPTNTNTPIIVDEEVYPILSALNWYETKDNYFRPSSWRTQGKKDIHRWVCWLYGLNINDKHIHHINHNRNDNRIDNLEILDKRVHTSKHHKNKKGFDGKKNPSYRQDITLTNIFGLLSRGLSVKRIAELLNTSPQTVYDRLNGGRP